MDYSLKYYGVCKTALAIPSLLINTKIDLAFEAQLSI